MPAEAYTQAHEKLDLEKIGKPGKSESPEVERWDVWFNEATEMRRERDGRWAKNIRLVRGIWAPEEVERSKVRKRSKIFFRKIWASNWRILAAMHEAFLREADQFRVVSRTGTPEAEEKAEILQLMVEYRRDVMMRSEDLFLQLVWAIMTILDLGWAGAKFCWKYKKDKDGKVVVDRPDFMLYPNEQIYPDLSASLPHKMRYLFFENFLTEEDIREEGWDPEGCEAYGPSESPVRNARNQGLQPDPASFSDTATNQTYPKPGTIDERKNPLRSRYQVKEVFYREGQEIKMAVYCGKKVFVQPMTSPYGSRYPGVFGQCLTLAHQLMGEGFPEPQEGPQTSLNVTLNQRKDNVSILMNGESIVDRYANVDLEALRTSRPANIILSDNTQAVMPLPKPDVTQNAWMEAQADASMMDESSGVTPGLQGMDKSQKATTSQINFSNSGAKMGLFISIVAQTFFRDFFTQLAYLIQRFETDEEIFKVANRNYRKKLSEMEKPVRDKDIEEIDDFVADVEIQVQPDMTTKEQEVRNLMLAMDRAIMSNQALVPLVQAGVVPSTGINLFNISEFMKPILSKLGYRAFKKFLITIPKSEVPPPAPAKGSATDPAAAGANTAQAESPGLMQSAMQDLQGGSNATGKLG
jgi:hypothetical protein